jgi:hypothetical protein
MSDPNNGETNLNENPYYAKKEWEMSYGATCEAKGKENLCCAKWIWCVVVLEKFAEALCQLFLDDVGLPVPYESGDMVSIRNLCLLRETQPMRGNQPAGPVSLKVIPWAPIHHKAIGVDTEIRIKASALLSWSRASQEAIDTAMDALIPKQIVKACEIPPAPAKGPLQLVTR